MRYVAFREQRGLAQKLVARGDVVDRELDRLLAQTRLPIVEKHVVATREVVATQVDEVQRDQRNRRLRRVVLEIQSVKRPHAQKLLAKQFRVIPHLLHLWLHRADATLRSEQDVDVNVRKRRIHRRTALLIVDVGEVVQKRNHLVQIYGEQALQASPTRIS